MTKYFEIREVKAYYKELNGEKIRFVKATVENVGYYACRAKIGVAELDESGNVKRWRDYEITNIYPRSEYTADLLAYEGIPNLYVVAAQCLDANCSEIQIDDTEPVPEVTEGEEEGEEEVGFAIPYELIAAFVAGVLVGAGASMVIRHG